MTVPPPRSESYWVESTEPTDHPPLTGDVEADVAVVGGGIAGVCTAWELARTGRSVVLVEADRILTGTTGYTTAKVTAQHSMIYDHLRSSFDAETARWYAQSQTEAMERIAETAAELDVECDLERVPAYTYVTESGRVPQIEAEVEAAREAGLPASLVDTTGLPFPVAAAIRVDGQLQFHPRRFLLAVAADLVARGGRIFERSRVVGLDEGEPCTLTTESGHTIKATDVVVATHYPVFDRALMFTRLKPRRELVVAAVIGADRDPGGMFITQEDHTRSVRTAPYGTGQRLLIVTGESAEPGAPGDAERLDRLIAWTRQHFDPDGIDYHWSAHDNDTTDRIPYIGRFHPGAKHTYVATGFGGWGMTNGVVAARLLTGRLLGDEPQWARIYDPLRVHPTVEAGKFVKTGLAVARHLIGDRLRRTHVDSPDDLAPGTGAVIRHRGHRCAVYRDDDGLLHAVSAVCTHLGCLVAFNPTDRTWDCPCHGSRFAPDGDVLHGPATKPLPPRAL